MRPFSLKTFRKANFDVVDARDDLGISKIRRVLRDFGGKARDASGAWSVCAGVVRKAGCL